MRNADDPPVHNHLCPQLPVIRSLCCCCTWSTPSYSRSVRFRAIEHQQADPTYDYRQPDERRRDHREDGWRDRRDAKPPRSRSPLPARQPSFHDRDRHGWSQSRDEPRGWKRRRFEDGPSAASLRAEELAAKWQAEVSPMILLLFSLIMTLNAESVCECQPCSSSHDQWPYPGGRTQIAP